MSDVPIEIVRAHLERELPRARELALEFGYKWDDDIDALTARAEFTAMDGEIFILCGEFDDYKVKPPFLEFEEPGTGVRGTPKAYPKSHDSFFHPTGPIICAPFSRKAYRDVHRGWRFDNWTTSTENSTNWSQFSTIAAMFGMVYGRLIRPDYYKGRLG